MILIYFLLGFIASVLGALPLGASNIAVINTTIKQNAKQAFKIITAAGLAELILSAYALHCSTFIQKFVENNTWIHFTIASILLAVGSYLLFKKQKEAKKEKNKRKMSKYALGLILGLINPPVLIYWIVAIGFINMNSYNLSLDSSLSIIVLFFSGIYVGKITTLYLYSRFSNYIKNRIANMVLIVNRVTGALLIFIGIFQTFRGFFI